MRSCLNFIYSIYVKSAAGGDTGLGWSPEVGVSPNLKADLEYLAHSNFKLLVTLRSCLNFIYSIYVKRAAGGDTGLGWSSAVGVSTNLKADLEYLAHSNF